MYGTDARKGDARALYMENRLTMWRVVKGGLVFDPEESRPGRALADNELRWIVTTVVTSG